MYIDWAVQRGYAVMDVNIPQALTTKEVSIPFMCVRLRLIIHEGHIGRTARIRSNEANGRNLHVPLG
jgi:hypothetical protein